MISDVLTPATIGNKKFSIPLYQRLFEWDTEQIEQLLSDLYDSFKKDADKPYYIGMLTTYSNCGRYDLVDGQQRFVVLMLLGVVLNWDKFVRIGLNNQMRLSFFARENDNKYLEDKLSGNTSECTNRKMEDGIRCIEKFLNDRKNDQNIEGFKAYIYKNTSFLLSELPQGYNLSDLNKHFERMNSSTRSLENHEILKVKLLKRVKPESRAVYTAIWNRVSDMDFFIINPGEKFNDLLAKVNNNDIKNIFIPEPGDDNEETESETIEDIIPCPEKIKSPAYYYETSRSFLSFPAFLLIVLSLTSEAAVSFNTDNLLSEFEKAEKSGLDCDQFFKNMLKYRLLLEHWFIRLGQEEEYILSAIDLEEGDIKENLIQFQSMLYVSSSERTYHNWLCPALVYLGEKTEVKFSGFLRELKDTDNKNHSLPEYDEMSFGSIDRYWFWRLDYYLWENRDKIFVDADAKKIAGDYIFKKNRSVEHIAPRIPKQNSKLQWHEENQPFMNSFGNLAMISPRLNSGLNNSSYEMKRAYTESYVNGSKTGSIESLKLLKAFEMKGEWNEASIKAHGEKMFEVLKDSFDITD